MTETTIQTKGSLCTGIGGLDMALPGALRYVAEVNEHADLVLKREYPVVPNLGDITQILVPYTDLLTAGFPCQPVSAAGRQKAHDDHRWLWPDVFRQITYAQPREIFLENVQNIVSIQGGRVLAEILGDLRYAGYAIRWTVLGACAIGAPHHRHRWFLRGVRTTGPIPEAQRVISKCGAPRSGGRVIGGHVLLPTPTTRDGTAGPGTSPQREGGMNLRTAVSLLPTPAARDGNGRGTPSPEMAARRIADPDRQVSLEEIAMVTLLPTPRATDIGTEGRRSSEGWRPQLGQAVSLLPTPRATDGVNGGPNQRGRRGDLAMGSAVQSEHWGKFAPAVALWERITGTPAPEPTVEAPRGGRRLNPELSEWMMGYRPGYLTADMPRNEALKAAGNGVVPAQARAAWDLLA